jgi:hypothetical protein
MAIEVTPLGFQKPDGYELVREGDNVIATNAQKAEELLADSRGRLVQLESAAGFGGSGIALSDAVVNPLLDTATATRGKLDARYVNETDNTASLALKVTKGEVAIRFGDYAPAANGTTDDSAKLLTAANAAVAAGLPLILDGSKRYNVNAGVVFPAGLRLSTFGCTFVKTVNNNTYALKTGDSFHADTLKLELAGGAGNDAGIYVNGSDTVIDRVKVTSLTADQPGANALLVGDLTTVRSNIRINGITLTGFRSPMRVINITESRLNNATISNFTTGVYVINATDTTFDKFKITGTSASSGTGPWNGMNGLLLESQNADFTSINLRFRDWIVDGAPEHSYRLGGSYSIADVTFEDCISRNPGNAPGNVSTGGGGFKVLGSNGHLHYNIRFINSTAEDGTTTASGINNHAQYNFGFVDGLTAINPTCKAKNKTYSGQIGMLIFAAKNVDIVEPNLKDTLRQALYLVKDSTEPSPPIGVSNLRVNGGFVDGASTNIVVHLDTQSSVMKDIFIDNLVASRGSTSFRNESATTVGSDVGSYSNVHVKIKYVNAPTASTTPPNNSPNNLVVFDYTGPIYGASQIPSADGGTYLNTGTGARYIRKAGAWTQQ